MKFRDLLLKAEKHPSALVLILSLGYLIVSSFLLNKYGVNVMNDSPRYLGYASSLQTGFHYDQLNFWYFSYVLFVYAHQVFTDSLLPIIISQYLLGLLATVALYKAAEILSNSKLTGFLAGVFFILFPDNLYWHSYILTESIYTSFVCFSLYALAQYHQSQSKKNLIFLLLVLGICFFCKPTSPALFIAILMPGLIKFLTDPAHRIFKLIGFILASVVVLVLANQMIGMHRVMLIYEKGDIIFAMHELPNHPYHDLLTVDTPSDLEIPESDGALIVNMMKFVIQNPIYWVKLFSGKLIMYLTHIRPYWSVSHNLMVLLLIWPSYFFAALAIKRKLVSKKLVIAVISYFMLHTLIISNTWVDWDARFFVPLLPILAWLGATGLQNQLLPTNKG